MCENCSTERLVQTVNMAKPIVMKINITYFIIISHQRSAFPPVHRHYHH